MKALVVSGIVFALIFGGTLLGMLLRSKLPVHHLSTESKEVIRLATALVGTLAALVLGLLVASTRSSYEQTSGQISRMIVDAVVLDWLLAEYGPEAAPLRHALRETIGSMVLMVLVLWLALIFASFAIFAPPNGTVATVLLVCVLSASSAIFLILEMGSPFQGLMQISSEPLRNALGPLTEVRR